MTCDLANTWLAEKLMQMGCDNIEELNLAKCKAPNKDVIAGWLQGALQYMSRQIEMNRELSEQNQDLSNTASDLRDQVIDTQQSVVKLQEQLIESKNEQLMSLQTTVKSSVQESVKAEFKSYSSAVQKGQNQQQTHENLKAVVKAVVEEEDRSRNIMMFGLAEEENELLSAKVSDVFQSIGEKPRVEVCRVGKRTDGARPVKVTLSSSVTVNQILAKAWTLRSCEEHKSVFLSADRSYEQRTRRRLLVTELKKKSADEPEKRHFIRNDKVCSVEKPEKP